LSPAILRLVLISQFLQHLPKHLGDLASITPIVLELAILQYASLPIVCNPL
jgi:hypothetical protein